MRHDLPGGWVEIRDSSELTERQARPVRKAYSTFASSLSRAIGPDVDTDKITAMLKGE